MKYITYLVLFFLLSCSNINSAKKSVPTEFCGQRIGSKFIESKCTPLYKSAFTDSRECKECENIRFKLTENGTIFYVHINDLTPDEMMSWAQDLTEATGEPFVLNDTYSKTSMWSAGKNGSLEIMISQEMDSLTKKMSNRIFFTQYDL